MIRIANFFDKLMQKYTPDPFIFAIALTFVVWILGIIFTPSSPTQMMEYWGAGFWSLLKFTLQMVMILVGGFLVASSEPVQKLLKKSLKFVKTPTQAIVMTTLIAILASWINWGFGLVIGAFVAIEMKKHLPITNFRILVASAYSGFLVWHGGLSGSIPLLLNTEGNFTQDLVGGLIATSETLFSPMNLTILVALIVILPWLNARMGKAVQGEAETFKLVEIHTESKPQNPTPAQKMENSKWVSYSIGAFGLAFVAYEVIQSSFKLDLNRINFVFLFLGLVLHSTPRQFLNSLNQASQKIGPIILQYPFYAGIMGMMSASGLAKIISEVFVNISNATTFPFFTFISAGIVNFFVPSGGGQWAIQGKIVIPAAEQLGVDLNQAAMAVAWGDAWTNMAQPFWALPLLAIAGLKIGDIMGFCTATLLVSGAIIGTVLFIF